MRRGAWSDSSAFLHLRSPWVRLWLDTAAVQDFGRHGWPAFRRCDSASCGSVCSGPHVDGVALDLDQELSCPFVRRLDEPLPAEEVGAQLPSALQEEGVRLVDQRILLCRVEVVAGDDQYIDI